MKRNTDLYIIWGMSYLTCASLAFIPQPPKVLAGIMVVCALLFFIPPSVVLYRALQRLQWELVRRIRNLSGMVLALTLVVLIINFLSVGASEVVGDVLFGLLILVSTPMVCGQAWIVGLFGWALLFTISRKRLKAHEG